MVRLYLFLILSFSANSFSQVVSGTVTDEEKNPLSGVLVINLQTDQTAYTNSEGEFTIMASMNNEIRWVRKGFERDSKILQSEDFLSSVSVSLKRNIQEIEEVEIHQQPTGNLAIDTKNYGDQKAVTKLKSETADYIRAKSSLNVLQAKPGEFIQPIGPGFSVGAPDNKWDDVDFLQYLLSTIQIEFFMEELKLKPTEIQPFIYYIFRNFPRKEILFYGICPSFDLSRFITETYKKIEDYRKNLPNNPLLTKKSKR